jgi:hypothetical protein
MVRFSKHLTIAGFGMALLLSSAAPLLHAQQTPDKPATTKSKSTKKSRVKKTETPAPDATSGATSDPINPTSSPEPPTPTTQGPPMPATTPPTNAPAPTH